MGWTTPHYGVLLQIVMPQLEHRVEYAEIKWACSSQTDYLGSRISTWEPAKNEGFLWVREDKLLRLQIKCIYGCMPMNQHLTTLRVIGIRLAIGDDSGADEIRLQHIVDGAVSATIITATGSFPNGLLRYGFLVSGKVDFRDWLDCYIHCTNSQWNGAIAT